MQLSEVRIEDGKACASLINLLKTGRWELSGDDAEELVRVKKWVHGLALSMAEKLKPAAQEKAQPSPAPASTAMKIKSRGPIGGKKK